MTMMYSRFKVQSSKLFSGFIVGLLPLFILLGISGYLFAAGMTAIRLLEKAEVEKDKIRLGEIARIKCEDPELAKELRAIVIGKAPLPGRTRQIDEQYIRLRLKQNAIDLSQISLHVPRKVEVFRGFVEISKEKIKKIVLDFMHQKIPWKRSRVRVKDVRVNRNVILPKGKITYEVILPKNTDFLGTIPLSVIFRVNRHFQKRVWATVSIEMLAEVVITRRPLRRYQLITEDDIRLQKMDLAELPSNIITSCEEVLGKRTKSAINANVVLRSDLVELPPLVRRGDVVLMIAESDGLKITALGEVRERGRRGERIRVVNLDSKREIYARVLDSKTVKVDF